MEKRKLAGIKRITTGGEVFVQIPAAEMQMLQAALKRVELDMSKFTHTCCDFCCDWCDFTL